MLHSPQIQAYWVRMAATKSSRGKKSAFSVTKAVKANARARVGQPPASFALPDDTKAARRISKHKITLQALLEKTSKEE
jgi:hypothetical protein